MPTPSTIAATAQERTIGELQAIGQRGDMRSLLAASVRVIEDPGAGAAAEQARAYAVASATALGFPTIARELLGAWRGEIPAELAPVIAKLDREPVQDRLEHAPRVAHVERIVGALAGGAMASFERVAEAMQGWRERAGQRTWLRSPGGLVAIREPEGRWWIGGDVDTAIRSLVIPKSEDDGDPMPMIVEGIRPPSLLTELIDRTPASNLGYSAAIHIVQCDPGELLDGLALLDDETVALDPRLWWHIGDDASEQLALCLRDRLGLSPPRLALVTPSTARRASPDPTSVVRTCAERQLQEHHRLLAHFDPVSTRPISWWADRFRRALAGDERPLRVIVLGTRYATFVRHSADDIADALRACGCDAVVAIEPDAHGKLTSVGWLHAIEQHNPDLIVTINYTRASMGTSVPAGIPTVCWVQDAMAHLLDRAAGAAQGPTDFMIGHGWGSLFDMFGYARSRHMPSRVVAHPPKFTPTTARTKHDSFDHELAYVSNHGESLDAQRDRLCAMSEDGGRVPSGLVARLCAIARDVAERTLSDRLMIALRDEYEREITRLSTSNLELNVELLVKQIGLPVADRVLRHQMIEWAAAIASRHGWRLALVGKHWETHPAFAPYAHPSVSHEGGELGRIYQRSALCLHASASGSTHQRVMECALAGGLTAARRLPDDLASLRRSALAHAIADALGDDDRAAEMNAAAARGEPVELDLDRTDFGRSYLEAARSAGEDPPPTEVAPPERMEPMRWLHGTKPASFDQRWLHGVDLRALTFTDESSLESIAAHAVEDPDWRAEQSAEVARRVRAHHTYEAVFRTALPAIARSMAESAGTRRVT
ncbi:MAG: glycosyltransferase [Planctomycetota bacterium]